MPQVAFKLRDGSTVFVETGGSDRGGLVGRGDELAQEAARTFEDALSSLRPIADAVLSELRDLAQSPDEVGIEFGVTLKLEGNLLVAKTAAEGNFKVSIKWKKGD